MSEAVRLDPEFPRAAAVSNEDQPRVLSRLATVPPAMPWEQVRAARMEARLGAPLPLAELTFQVRRLGRWRPGSQGRFAIFYVRTRELRGPFETVQTVEGEAVPVAFGRTPAALPALGSAAFVLLLIVLCGAVAGTALTLGLKSRAQSEDRLEEVERLASAKLAAAQAYRRSIDEGRAVRAVLGRGAPVADVLGDLSWVAANRTSDARIVGVHWRDGVMGVEVKGDPPPFGTIDRRLQRSPKQLRPGVWLWGVGPAGSAPPGRPAP